MRMGVEVVIVLFLCSVLKEEKGKGWRRRKERKKRNGAKWRKEKEGEKEQVLVMSFFQKVGE